MPGLIKDTKKTDEDIENEKAAAKKETDNKTNTAQKEADEARYERLRQAQAKRNAEMVTDNRWWKWKQVGELNHDAVNISKSLKLTSSEVIQYKAGRYQSNNEDAFLNRDVLLNKWEPIDLDFDGKGGISPAKWPKNLKEAEKFYEESMAFLWKGGAQEITLSFHEVGQVSEETLKMMLVQAEKFHLKVHFDDTINAFLNSSLKHDFSWYADSGNRHSGDTISTKDQRKRKNEITRLLNDVNNKADKFHQSPENVRFITKSQLNSDKDKIDQALPSKADEFFDTLKGNKKTHEEKIQAITEEAKQNNNKEIQDFSKSLSTKNDAEKLAAVEKKITDCEQRLKEHKDFNAFFTEKLDKLDPQEKLEALEKKLKEHTVQVNELNDAHEGLKKLKENVSRFENNPENGLADAQALLDDTKETRDELLTKIESQYQTLKQQNELFTEKFKDAAFRGSFTDPVELKSLDKLKASLEESGSSSKLKSLEKNYGYELPAAENELTKSEAKVTEAEAKVRETEEVVQAANQEKENISAETIQIARTTIKNIQERINNTNNKTPNMELSEIQKQQHEIFIQQKIIEAVKKPTTVINPEPKVAEAVEKAVEKIKSAEKTVTNANESKTAAEQALNDNKAAVTKAQTKLDTIKTGAPVEKLGKIFNKLETDIATKNQQKKAANSSTKGPAI